MWQSEGAYKWEITAEEKEQRDGGKRSDPTLLALNMEKGGHESRNTAASKSWKGQGNSLP